MHKSILYFSAAASLLMITSSQAAETPIGKPVKCYGMEVGAVYLQPVPMMPRGMMNPVNKSDIHLEADIHATDKNVNGFQEGAWIPYLSVHYKITKEGSKEIREGNLMAMTANDGPHYGENVKLMGPGKYHLVFDILPPDYKGEFGYHIDKETGVKPFFKKCRTEYDFVYLGTGKKGGY